MDAVPAALVALTLVGGAYLLHLGVATLRSTRTVGAPNLSPTSDAVSPTPVSPTPVSPTTAGHGFLRRGIAVSALNPKSLLFFLAFLPQFTRQGAPWPMPVQLFVLGVVWVVLAGLVYAAMGFTVQRTLAQRPHLQRGVALVAGVAMVLSGVGLLGEQLVHTLTSAA